MSTLPDLVDGQIADAVRLDVFERGPVPVRSGAQRQIDLVDHDRFDVFDAQFGDSCGTNKTKFSVTTPYDSYRILSQGSVSQIIGNAKKFSSIYNIAV